MSSTVGFCRAAALTFRQRRIVLEAIGLAIDRLLDRTLCGFCLLTVVISHCWRSIFRRMRRVRGNDRLSTEKKQRRAHQQRNDLSHPASITAPRFRLLGS